MQKNTAGQKWEVFAFDKTNSDPVTGDAANITANLRKDHGSAAAIADTNPTELEDGRYVFDMAQAESNGDYLALYPESLTADVMVIAWPANLYTTDPIAAGTVPEATETYLTDLIARRDAIGAELAQMSTSKAGGVPNVQPNRNADGVNVDHVAYRLSLLKELKSLNELIEKAQKDAQADAGGVGIVESEEWP